MMGLVECAVYVLYEQDHIKIGMSDSPAKRAKKVTPDVDKNISYAMIFNSRKKARNCEVALHRFFSAYHVPARKKYGRTEFFNRSCGDKLESFIKDNCELLGYKEIRVGDKLFSNDSSLSLSKEDLEMRRIIRQEDKNLLRRREAEERKTVFQSVFKQLKSENCLVGVSRALDEEKKRLSIFILYESAQQKEMLDKLRWNSLYHDGDNIRYLLSVREQEGAEDEEDEKIDPEFYQDMERVFSNTGPYYEVYDILQDEEGVGNCKEIFDFFEVEKNIYSLPILEDEKLELAKEILGIDQPYIFSGIHLFEEKEDGSERRMVFYTKDLADEIALTLCDSYWNTTLSKCSGEGPWYYVAYKGTARKYTKIRVFGRSQGNERYFREDAASGGNFEPHPIVAKSSDKYDILSIHSLRAAANHKSDAANLYVYYENDSSIFYAVGQSCQHAYSNLQHKCREKGWRIITA